MPDSSLRKPQRSFRNHPDYQELASFVSEVLAEQQPQALILYGSAARGDHNDESDLDVLVVLDRVKENTWQEVYRHSRGTVTPLIWQRDALMRELTNDNDFLRTILNEGVFLAGDEMLWKRLHYLCEIFNR